MVNHTKEAGTLKKSTGQKRSLKLYSTKSSGYAVPIRKLFSKIIHWQSSGNSVTSKFFISGFGQGTTY